MFLWSFHVVWSKIFVDIIVERKFGTFLTLHYYPFSI